MEAKTGLDVLERRIFSCPCQGSHSCNENFRNIGQGEANHRKYKRLKLGGGQAYDRSSV
jgi:hypothetical protein